MSPADAATATCPSCGAAAPPLLRHAKLAVCAYCHSTLFVDDAQVRAAGETSVLAQVPSILALGRRFAYRDLTFEPVGRIRYEYGDGDGYWDEWWVLLADGTSRWISNDEGEHVIQHETGLAGGVPPFASLAVGATLRLGDLELLCTELNAGTCTGIEGQLPAVVRIGETHRYAHLEGAGNLLITAEYRGDRQTVYEGRWIDPFELTPA